MTGPGPSYYWNGDPSGAAEIVIDLGSEKTFSQIKVLPGSSSTQALTWEYKVSNDNITFLSLQNNYQESADPSTWGITNLDESVSYRYIKVDPISWPNSWIAIIEIEFWNDVVFQGPEFSTYIYLATLAFTFAIGYRKMPELMREKN